MATQLVRFDWAIKHLLRHKTNFGVLEGFLSVLLDENVKIKQILSSQSNQETGDDKYNDVDILVENAKGELIIVEVQNTKEHDYFHRILFGTSKVLSEYISEGQIYAAVKKVISITIAYFDLGQGEDYVYHGTNTFKGIHKGDFLMLSDKQKELYQKQHVHEIYPEYWIIKAGLFNEEEIHDELDEWIYFFKTGEVKNGFTAAGLAEAKKKLNKLKLTPQQRKEYNEFVERMRKIASYQATAEEDAKDLIKDNERKLKEALLEARQEGRVEEKIEIVLEMYKIGMLSESIALVTKLTIGQVQQIIDKYQKEKE